MSWPALEFNVKGIDASIYQNLLRNTSEPEAGRIDWYELATQNPEIKVGIVRATGSSSGIDPDFQYNFDEGSEAGFDMGVYLNMSPTRSIDWLMKNWWKPAIGDRNPKLIVFDTESRHGKSKAVCTTHIQDGLGALTTEWPEAEIWDYTGAWWWNPNVEHGWEANVRFWLGHYPHFVQESDGSWRQAYHFSEVDGILPIHNNFTPRLPFGVGIHQVMAFQFSEKGILVPITQAPKLTPRVDLNYILLTAYNRIWGDGEGPVPEPDPDPVPVEIRIPAGKAVVTVTEV